MKEEGATAMEVDGSVPGQALPPHAAAAAVVPVVGKEQMAAAAATAAACARTAPESPLHALWLQTPRSFVSLAEMTEEHWTWYQATWQVRVVVQTVTV